MTLKDIRIKLKEQKKKKILSKLWQDSPCCHNYVSQSVKIDTRTPRFKYGSIYFKDQQNKQKIINVINTDLEHPDRLLILFRKQIQAATHPIPKSSEIIKKNNNTKQKCRIKSQPNSKISYLYQTFPKLRYCKSNCQSPEIDYNKTQQISSLKTLSKINISSNKKMYVNKQISLYHHHSQISPKLSPFPQFFSTSTETLKKNVHFDNPETARFFSAFSNNTPQ